MAEKIRFDKPPVVEVVCGVLFSTPTPLRAAQVGLFWRSIRKEFPRIEEMPPISPAIEGSQAGTMQEIEFSLGTLPPLRRTWLLSDDGRHLIQIQEDRFLFNWKREADEDAYPSYDVVIQKFDDYLAKFVKFMADEEVGQPSYRQFELTYVNHITSSNGLGDVGEAGVLVDHIQQKPQKRFLPRPENFNWTTSYPLPANAGRLHIAAQSAARRSDGGRIVRLDLIARGISANPAEIERRPWFDMAHQWITNGFADATSTKLHKIWERAS